MLASVTCTLHLLAWRQSQDLAVPRSPPPPHQLVGDQRVLFHLGLSNGNVHDESKCVRASGARGAQIFYRDVAQVVRSTYGANLPPAVH